ncbi:MAG: hypothetical protein R3213_12365, partial [Flavobacteriaceae bacterium]|nr:hypothetical protein [Flavobacteriaceae bacterium]
ILAEMKREWLYILMVVAALITIYGLVTGRFLFLFLMIPFGFGLFRKRKEDEDDDIKKLED